MTGELVRVEAAHFVAGLIVREGHCVYAAPIIRWACGMRVDALRAALRRKRYRATIVR